MKFVTLDPRDFTKFAQKHPNKSFLQTTEIAALRKKNGWTPYYLGVENDNKLIAAAMLVAKPTFIGKSTFYCPGGPLVDYEDKATLTFFVNHLKSYAKSHNGYVIHIEPYYEKIERDCDGNIVKDGYNREIAVTNLKNLGFRSAASDNPTYLFALDIYKRNPDEVFASFKQNTRNLISRAARKGVTIRELSKKELPLFKQITEATSERRHFSDKTLDYYETMYDLFARSNEVKFIIAEVGKTPIAAAMFMTYGDEVIYLFSGSDEKYMKEYNAQYAIQWHMIKYALGHGFKRYNFYGIQGLPDPNKPGYGIYRFKKGFGGRVIELLGAYDLPLSPLYSLHKCLSKIRGRK